MSAPVWDKAGATVNADTMAYMAGDDIVLDREIIAFDITATAAHADGLARIGVLSEGDAAAIREALEHLATDLKAGVFTLDARYEDCHSAIEAYLTQRLGDLGKRIHIGRSRNDQVLTAMRLYMIDALDAIHAGAVSAGRAALDLARKHEMTPMPGYTHTQRAMPSSVGLWMASFAEAFADDADLIAFTRQWISASPLGTASGYGVNLPLDRAGVSRDLGFDRVQVNPMYVQASRGKFELQALAAAWQAAQTIRRLAWDLVQFASQEYGFVTLGDDACTGSSIMPNKRNPDLAELLRAAAAPIAGAMNELQQVTSLPSGYHRDLQLTKGPMIRGLTAARRAIGQVAPLLAHMTIHEDAMRQAIDAPMHATDLATKLAADGVPFRDAYRKVGESLDALAPADPMKSVRDRMSYGGCASLALDDIAARLDARPIVHTPNKERRAPKGTGVRK